MVPLQRLVLTVVGIGLLAQLLAALVVGGQGAVTTLRMGDGVLGHAQGWPLVVVLLVLTFAGDWVNVYVRRGQEVEALTLFEVAVVVDLLVLPAGPALVLPVVATVLCSLVRRRSLLKTAFNGGNLAAAVAVAVIVLHQVSAPGTGLTVRALAALTIGMVGLTVLNLVAMSWLLATVGDEDPDVLVREGLRLSLVIAVGSVALGATAVTLTWAAPALLPATLMPLAALMFAFRAAAQEAEERERSTRLLALSQVLAGPHEPEEVLASFLALSRRAFGGDVTLALLDVGQSRPIAVVDDRESGVGRRACTAEELRLYDRTTRLGAAVLRKESPAGWDQTLVAPLEAEGRRLGAVVLATRDRRRDLGGRELTLLTSTASALAVALRGAAHLRRLVEETSKLQAVVDQSSDGILVLDAEGTVQLWSPAVSALTGRGEVEALGRPLRELLPALGPDGLPCEPFTVGRRLLTPTERQATVEITVLREDGEQRVVRCSHAGVFDDDGLLARDVVMLHDVTRERQVERLKADFIATVSHELRTPVTPIKGYADLLRRKGELMTPEKRSECLDVISDRASHLARLVEDLLLASRISATEGTAAAQVEMGADDLVALVRRGCGDFGLEGDRVVLHLPDSPVDVACDRVRVIQVLTNLVGNALKYSTPGTRVDVGLRVDGQVALVEVQDRGRGIPADHLERVFEKFHRVEDPMRMTTGGTGLGLYIARQLATAMSGTLTCRSTLGVGSVFTLGLRLAQDGSADAVPGVVSDAPAVPGTRSPGAARAVPAPRGTLDQAPGDAPVPLG